MTEQLTPRLTTVGSLLIKKSLPNEKTRQDFDLYSPLTKNGVSKLVNSLLSDGGPTGVDHINSLGKQFFNTATEIGASTPLSDYVNESDERHAIIQEFQSKVDKIAAGGGDKRDKNKKLLELVGGYNDRIEKQNLSYLLGRNSTAAKMANTGARGNPKQLALGTSTPLMSFNVKSELVPLVIHHSFAQGMRPAEHIALSYLGRGSTVLAQLSTALPGALFKKLSPTVFHEVITSDNCHTKNGIYVPISDARSLVGRFTADTDTEITAAVLKNFATSGVERVKVRSAMTCEAKPGVCQHCYGLWANGKLPEVGTNVGIVAAQSVSEVLTQAMLATKHKTSVSDRKGNKYEQASNILNNPTENFKDEATISSLGGKVESVQQTSLGDYHVNIDGKTHFVPISQQVLVKPKDIVRIGDRLSTGTINPRKLVALRGVGAGRKYMADELRDIYGEGLDPRHFEVIAKNMIKYVEVIDPGETGFLPGEKLNISDIQGRLQEKEMTVPLSKAEGKVLSRGIFQLTPGSYLDASHIQDLKHDGVKEVTVTGCGLVVKPLVPGLQTAKLLDRNWVSNLSFSKLRDTLKEAAAVGAETEVHSTDPIASYVMGSEFGEGKDGRY